MDVDSDGSPEVLIRFSCGAHTRVLNVFKINTNGDIALIPGADIGSDWPEIEIEDRDIDGKVEIYAKQRNWNGEPSQEFITEVYKNIDGEFTKMLNT